MLSRAKSQVPVLTGKLPQHLAAGGITLMELPTIGSNRYARQHSADPSGPTTIAIPLTIVTDPCQLGLVASLKRSAAARGIVF